MLQSSQVDAGGYSHFSRRIIVRIEGVSANMRTSIVLDDKLVAKAMKRAGVTTKKAAVEAALKAYVAKPIAEPDYSALLALRGSGVISDDYDPKEPYCIRAGTSAAPR
jgi:Arc/MetJ family transcription regulator